jgi:hypothetical protein
LECFRSGGRGTFLEGHQEAPGFCGIAALLESREHQFVRRCRDCLLCPGVGFSCASLRHRSSPVSCLKNQCMEKSLKVSEELESNFLVACAFENSAFQAQFLGKSSQNAVQILIVF